LLGYTDAALQDEVVDAFVTGDGAAVFSAIDRVIEAGLEPRRFVQDLLERFRDLLVLDAVPDAADSGLLDAPADQLERMRSQAEHYGRASLSRAADVMAAALVDMRGTTSPRLVLELACARVLLPGAASDTSALLARLDNLERRIAAGVVGAVPAAAAAPAVGVPPVATDTPDVADAAVRRPDEPGHAEPAAPVVPEEPVAASEPEPAAATPGPTPPAAPAPSSGGLDVAGLRRLWDSVLDAVKQRSRTAHALMMSSQIESLDGLVLTLSFKTPTLATRFANDVADFVTEALREVVGLDLKVRATTGDGSPPPPTTAPAPAPGASEPAAPVAPVSSENLEPDEIDLSDEVESAAAGDPADAALALAQDILGGQVIGEIDNN